MSLYKRAKQLEVYDGTQTWYPPVWTRDLINDKKRKQDDAESSSSDEREEKRIKAPDGGTAEPGLSIQQRPTFSGVSVEVMMASFDQSMKEVMIKKIKPLLSKPNKLKELKDKLLKSKTLPPGTFTRADELAKCTQGEIQRYFDSNMAPPIRNVVKWTNYVTNNFDSIESDLLSQPTSSNQAIESKLNDISILSEPSSQETDVSMASQPSVSSSNYVANTVGDRKEEDYSFDAKEETGIFGDIRTVTVPFSSILHGNLEDDIKNEIYTKINDNIHKFTDFISDYGFVVYSIMLSMKNLEFYIDKDTSKVALKECQGFNISQLFPDNFEPRGNAKFTAQPLPTDVLVSEDYLQEFKTLFGDKHLDFIFSTFFGQKGPQKTTIDAHPIQHLLNTSSKTVLSEVIEKQDLPSTYIMQMARELYKINMQNMWAGHKQRNKLLDKLLDVLLKIRLAPKREQNYVDMRNKKKKAAISKKTENDSENLSDYKNLTRNQRRNIIRAERYKMNKYQKIAGKKNDANSKEKWNKSKEAIEKKIAKMSKINKAIALENESKEREKRALGTSFAAVESSSNVLTEEIVEDIDVSPYSEELFENTESLAYPEQLSQEDTVIDKSNDTSRRRLGELKAIIKDKLFKFRGELLTEANLLQSDKDMTEQELDVCLDLANTIMQYMPSKENYSSIGCQLPFILFANDILDYAGYSKFRRNICPMTKPSSLNALRIDSSSVYYIFSRSKENPIKIRDYGGYVINNEQQARTHKDAIFHAFFDLPKITDICKSRKLKFIHNLTVLPGLKLVIIMGEKAGFGNASTKKQNKKQPSSDLPWDTILEYQKKTDKELDDIMENNKKQVKKEVKQLKDHSLKMTQEDFPKQKKALKLKWIKKEERVDEDTEILQNLYQAIEEVKKKRRSLEKKILTTKQKISRLRQETYVCLKAKNMRGSNILSTTDSRARYIIKGISNNGVIKRTEDMELLKSIDSLNGFTFCGTDNGLVTMTETISMSLERFGYHLNLHNRFDPLQEQTTQDDISDDSVEFLPLKDTFKIKSEDIDYNGGFLRQRKRLEMEKKYSTNGKKAAEIEKTLSKSSIQAATNVEEAIRIHDEKKKNRHSLRDFYYSNKMVSIQKSVMLWNSKYRDKLCSRERKHVKETGKHLVMLIGDRGFGYGSRISGFNRYGGKWKQKIHGRYTTVAITNENKTSQTCVYCFCPIIHPKQRVKIRGKSILKDCNGAMQCTNPKCISVINGHAIQSRDKVSSMAIAISGLSTLIFQNPPPVFSRRVSQSYTDYKKITNTLFSFGKRSGGRAHSQTV